jgi:hypothetical protein
MEGAGEARFDCFGVNRVGRGGNLGKTDQYITLYYFSANLENKIKSFNPSIDHPIAEVLPGGLCGGARFDRFGGNQVGRGGGNLNKIDQYI